MNCALRVAALVACVSLTTPVRAQATFARERLIAHLTGLASDQTTARRARVASIVTPREAQARQVRVRTLLAEMIGFKRATGPVRAEVTRRSAGAGYTVESLWYESLPGYRVTANLYRPAEGDGPFPALIVQPGHSLDGKLGDHSFAVNFVRAGYIVLSIDIVGEGERLQHYDPEIGASKVGRPTGEHSMAFEQALPGGGHVARFFIQDASRGVDYLVARPDVDNRRIGAFGCSGGGTITAYLAALDPRVRATATACYVNDFDHLLAPGGPGPQDAEQSIPFFLERGLDLPDWVKAVAPRPYAVVSTTEDMFPIAGARAAFAEARRFYTAMDAADRITMIEGPGGHGSIAPLMPRIVSFFDQWLKDTPGTAHVFTQEPLGDPARLLVTQTGQLSTERDGGLPLRAVIARETPLPPAPPAGETAQARLGRLRVAIHDIAHTRVEPGDPAPRVVTGVPAAAGGAVPIHFDAAPGLRVDGLYATATAPGRHPTLLFLSGQPLRFLSTPAGLFERWTAAGWNVLALEPRGAGGSEEAKSPLTGNWTLLSLRALMVGLTPIGMRVDDAVAALSWLATRPEVDARRLDVQGVGALAPVALHLGVVDPRVRAVTAEDGILRYRDFAERPLARDMAEVNLPGVLARYDLTDLAAVLGDRLTLVNPVSAVGEPLTREDVTGALHFNPRVVLRGSRDSSPPPAR